MSVESFDNIEDVFRTMAQRETAANQRLTDAQRELQPGDLVLRLAAFGDTAMVILGRTFTEEEFMRREEAAGAPMDAEEVHFARASFRDRVARGFLFGEYYSLAEPRGELGDAHRSTIRCALDRIVFDFILDMIQQGKDPLPILVKEV